jgi:hypothetical protein
MGSGRMSGVAGWVLSLLMSVVAVAGASRALANDKCCRPAVPQQLPYGWCTTSCGEPGAHTCATETRCQLYTDGACDDAVAMNCVAISEYSYAPKKLACAIVPCPETPYPNDVKCDEVEVGVCSVTTRKDCTGATCP